MDIKILTKSTVNIIFAINDKVNYQQEISRRIGTTASSTFKMLDRLKDAGIVEYNRAGRKKLINFTKKGLELKEILYKLALL